MLTEQVKMKKKKDNDKIEKSVQTSSACGRKLRSEFTHT